MTPGEPSAQSGMTPGEPSAQTTSTKPSAAPLARATPGWLALREPADAAARSSDLLDLVRPRLPRDHIVVHDLGCGTGSMVRWLAPLLPGRQHWVLCDRDQELLDHAVADLPSGADGSTVTAETRRRDITRLDGGELTDASLITASALLDMFTADELDRFVDTCVASKCPVLLTISVVGRVELTPTDPLDTIVADAFNTHQRRTSGSGRLLGPDAVDAAVTAFNRLGAEVLVRPSPWLLGPGQAELTAAWFTGWLDAACQQRPELATATADYGRRRLAQATAGELSVTVHHLDLLALPG